VEEADEKAGMDGKRYPHIEAAGKQTNTSCKDCAKLKTDRGRNTAEGF